MGIHHDSPLREWRYRTVHCELHTHGQFAAELCPWCDHRFRMRPDRASPLRPSEAQRRAELDAAVLAAIEEATPSTFTELAWRASKFSPRKVLPSNAAVALDRLRRDGKTTVTIVAVQKNRHKP